MGQFLGLCEGLIHGRLTDRPARERQARLIATQFFAPFFLAAFLAPPAFKAWGAHAALAIVAALFAASLTNVVIAAGGRALGAARIAAFAVAFAAGTLGTVLGAPGPALVVLALALVAESAFVTLARDAVAKAFVSALPLFAAALFLQAPADGTSAVSAAGASIAYLALAAARGMYAFNVKQTPPPAAPGLEARLDAVVLTMTRDGDVQSASQQARRILGLEPDLLIGTGFFERVRVSDRVKLLCALSSPLAQPQAVRVTVRIPGSGAASTAHLDVELELIRDADDWTVVLREAGEIARLEAALEEAADQAAALDVAKSRFLAAVSHELRTPLNAIIGFSDMLLYHAPTRPLSDKQAEHIGLIREAGNHLLAVVNSILDVSKIEAGAYTIHPEPFAVEGAIRLTTSLLEGQAASKGVELTVGPCERVGELNADQRAINQILLNLVSNAIKFTPTGGRIEVSATRTGDMVALCVADTGIGIAPGDLASLGRPFAQVQNDYTRQFEGAGLGLSLVKGLVGLHGGELDIQSAPGEGTTVTVRIPAVPCNDTVTTFAPISTADGQGMHGTFRKIA